MKKLSALTVLMIASFAAAQSDSAKVSMGLSPAEYSAKEAHKTIEEKPAQYAGYNLLALALVHRAQETSDASYYDQAEDAVKKSSELAPNNFETDKIQVSILLGEHEFGAALATAKALNKRVPDDLMVYGLLTDANVGLGNYSDAENAAQWMLNLRPGNLPALLRAAHLRELFGDVDGSLDLMNMAYQSTPPSDLEGGAWIVTQMAHLKLAIGKIDEAERLSQQALAMFPEYHCALGNLAKVRIEQKRFGEAVELLKKRYQAVPHAADLYELAQALELAGRTEEAREAFAEFEQKSLLETNRADNANLELIFYYADYAKQPAKALEVAKREYARRHDVYTLDSYAWALYVNGQYANARQMIEMALAVGVLDAQLFRHAGEITLKAGDISSAERYLRQSADMNTLGSGQARATLATLSTITAWR